MRTIPRLIVTGITVALFAVLTGVAAHADEGDDAKTSWAVAPADAEGPDGRRVMELEADPGETIDEHFAVTNLSTHEATFSLRAADGYVNDKGRFNTIPSDQESVASGTWAELPGQVTLAPKQTAVIPLRITVPANAEPGDHAAGVSASILTMTKDKAGSSVGIESRVGFRLTVTVTGEVRAAAAISDIETRYDTNWNPGRPGSGTVSFILRNEGNVRFLGEGVLRIAGREIAFPAADEPRQEMLPGDERSFTLPVADLWPTLIVRGSVDVEAQVVGPMSETAEVPPVSARAEIIAVPWPQAVVALGAAMIIAALLWNRGRNKAKVAELVAQAREEGRRAAKEEETP